MTASTSSTMPAVDGKDLCARARDALRRGDPTMVSDAEVTEMMTLALRLYAAKSEVQGPTFQPVDSAQVSATDIVVAVSGMLHAANLNLFDVAMWYRRPGYGEIPAGGFSS
jgi:hypothetical protein